MSKKKKVAKSGAKPKVHEKNIIKKAGILMEKLISPIKKRLTKNNIKFKNDLDAFWQFYKLMVKGTIKSLKVGKKNFEDYSFNGVNLENFENNNKESFGPLLLAIIPAILPLLPEIIKFFQKNPDPETDGGDPLQDANTAIENDKKDANTAIEQKNIVGENITTPNNQPKTPFGTGLSIGVIGSLLLAVGALYLISKKKL